MKITGLSHIAIAVPSVDQALAFYRDVLGFELERIEAVPSEGMKAAMLEKNGLTLEVMEPTNPQGAVARFVDKRGGGLHHFTLTVENLDEAIAECRAKGLQFVEPSPRPGSPSRPGKRIAFLHPKSTGGVLIELTE